MNGISSEKKICRSGFTPKERSTNSVADLNLCRLFKSIGKDIAKDNPSVFFTNFVLCYRAGDSGISGGFKQKWGNNCSPFFERLVRIIEPKVIICLGRVVYYNVLKTAKIKCQKGTYNDIITGKPVIADFGGHGCKIFPVAHCGTLGTANRNNGNSNSDIKLQKQDWARIKVEIG